MDNTTENKNLYFLGTKVNYLVTAKNFEGIFKSLILKGNSKIFTVNPEFIVDSYFDIDFQKTLNSSDLNVIDGVGLVYGIKKHFKNFFTKKELKEIKTFPGADIVDEILKIADKNHYSLFILGGSKDFNISQKALFRIQKKYPGIKVVGGSSDFSYLPVDDTFTVDYIKERLGENSLSELDILLVGYGHKKQEFWIKRNSSKIPARVSIGVGGTLDFLSGHINRAPKWLRSLGLEWFYRFLIQPRRFFRIIKATLIFSYLTFFYNLRTFSKK